MLNIGLLFVTYIMRYRMRLFTVPVVLQLNASPYECPKNSSMELIH
jgi:hypothetical protein